MAGKWREATMGEACEFMQGRKLARDYRGHRTPGVGEMAVVEFEDGSKVGCESRWSGPYSEVTPDIDGDPPGFFIFEPEPDHGR